MHACSYDYLMLAVVAMNRGVEVKNDWDCKCSPNTPSGATPSTVHVCTRAHQLTAYRTQYSRPYVV